MLFTYQDFHVCFEYAILFNENHLTSFYITNKYGIMCSEKHINQDPKQFNEFLFCIQLLNEVCDLNQTYHHLHDGIKQIYDKLYSTSTKSV